MVIPLSSPLVQGPCQAGVEPLIPGLEYETGPNSSPEEYLGLGPRS